MSALACAGDSSAGPASAKAGSEALHQKMMQGAKDMQTMQMSGDVDHDFIKTTRLEAAVSPWLPASRYCTDNVFRSGYVRSGDAAAVLRVQRLLLRHGAEVARAHVLGPRPRRAAGG